jgi:hypothetical protein
LRILMKPAMHSNLKRPPVPIGRRQAIRSAVGYPTAPAPVGGLLFSFGC